MIDHFDKRCLDIFGVRFVIIQQDIQVDVLHAGDTMFSACRILHYDLGYLLFCCNTNVKIAQVYRNRRNFTTTCRKIYALFAAHSVKTQHIRVKALNSVLFGDKYMSGKHTVIPAAIIVKEILIFY